MKKYMIEQNGRSMIEMLGVLAIVGVLSVAGIAGYSKAMAKYKVNKVTDQVTMLAANIKTTFAGQGNYEGLDGAATAYDLGVIPDDMIKTCASDATGEAAVSAKCIRNGLGGSITAFVTGTTDTEQKFSFDMYVDGLTKDACATLLTADWGTAAGMKSVLYTESSSAKINDDGKGVTGSFKELTSTTGTGQSAQTTTISVVAAATKGCKCGTASTCMVGWRFY